MDAATPRDYSCSRSEVYPLMQPPPLSKPVVRDDGVRGTIVSSDTPGRLILKFEDGTSLRVTPDALVSQGDGSYRLIRHATGDRGRTAFRL